MISSHQSTQYEISYHTTQGLVKTVCATKEAFDIFLNQIINEYGNNSIVEISGPNISTTTKLLLG